MFAGGESRCRARAARRRRGGSGRTADRHAGGARAVDQIGDGGDHLVERRVVVDDHPALGRRRGERQVAAPDAVLQTDAGQALFARADGDRRRPAWRRVGARAPAPDRRRTSTTRSGTRPPAAAARIGSAYAGGR